MYDDAIKDLQTADKIIKKRHRYTCGLENGEGLKESTARFFFSSPDGQNGELYYELKNLGWHHSMYQAEYHWRVWKDEAEISYTEGDVYLSEHVKVKDRE